MDELIHYYSVDVSVVFNIDLESDQIDTELISDIHDTFVEELQDAFKNNPDVDLDDYDWDRDKDHNYIQYLYISSKLDKAAVMPIVKNILDSVRSFERTDELRDGTYSIETYGLDTPPYQYVANTFDYTYNVNVECEIIRFFETDEDGEILVEKVTKNELKDRAKKHAKKQRGITTLNPDAGNVEYNIGMFNKMSGSTEGLSNNPVSGPFGGNVSGGGMSESFIDDYAKQKSVDLLTRLNSLESCKGVSKVPYELAVEYKSVLNEFPVGTVLKLKIDAGEETYTKTDSEFWKHYRAPWGDTKVIHVFDLARWFAGRKYISRSSIEYSLNELNEADSKKETIELEYKDLEFTQYGNQRDADDWDEWERCMDWTYEVDKDDLYTFIFESCIDETDFPEAFDDDFDPNNAEDWAKFESWLDDNFDAIYSKYEDKILENWEEDAAEQAAQEYDPDDYVDRDSMSGGHDDKYWEDLKEGEEVFMEKYSMGPSEEYKQEPRMIDYFESMNKEDKLIMKIKRLNEEAKRFYVDEIVSAPGRKTKVERHYFATLDELKQYCKDAGLTKDDIESCGGCDVKDLCEGLEGSLHIKRLGINEKFDTAEYRIQMYEDDIPELMADMHDDYMEGKLDAARYAEVLKKVYDALAECDYKHTMSSPVVTNGAGKRVLDALDKLDEEVEAYNPLDKDDPDTRSWKEMVEYKLDDPYGEFLDNLYPEFVKDAYKLVEAEGFTDVFTEPSTEAGRGTDFFWAKKNGVDYRGHYDFERLNDGFGDCCLAANSREEALALCAKYYANIIINNLIPEDLEDFEYDDEYSDDYIESLDKCSGIRAHKVIMGEGVDDVDLDSSELDDVVD